MIAQLRGKVCAKAPNLVIVEVGGVGFQVFIPLSTFYCLPEPGEEVFLLTRTHLREDGISLYGFLSEAERALFDLLCGISGIGPRLATNILSGISPDELTEALSAGDSDRLQAIPGVGKKLAGRMALELREKVRGISIGAALKAEPEKVERNQMEDLVSALVNLGYHRQKASRAASSAVRAGGGQIDFEGLIKEALRTLTS
ncbi:MAG TPA: Holliday junction branch migration protein RuvA [Candidatus Methylomirabilis sp.]|jgi:Holliday junction DNA helicase RuvA